MGLRLVSLCVVTHFLCFFSRIKIESRMVSASILKELLTSFDIDFPF